MNAFTRLLHRRPRPANVQPMVEALRDLKVLAPAEWENEVEKALHYARQKRWGRVWDRLQAAAGANAGTPFGDAAEPLRARAERLAMASGKA